MKVFDKMAVVQELAEKITPAQFNKMAVVHRINVEDVQDAFQNMICKLLDGTSKFNPEKGKLEHWARATLSCECLKIKGNCHIGLDDFNGEDINDDCVVDTAQVKSFEVAEVNDELDLFEHTDNPLWNNAAARFMVSIHEKNDLAENDFWDAAANFETLATALGLCEKQARNKVDEWLGKVEELKSEGMAGAEIEKLFGLDKPLCKRQRAPKKKRPTDTVSVPEPPPQLF